jgi:TRAP-type uncharacterized transport system substrate-binding protein
MKKYFFVGAFASLLCASSVMAGQVTLCAGKEGGGYDNVMRAVGIELQKQGHEVTIKNMDGSESILNALETGQCNYGPAQKDIHYLLSKNDAAFEKAVRPAAVLYNEVMTMVCSKESGIDELSDITDKNTVIVDTIGSGSALTWDNMVQIEKDYGSGSSWSKATPVYVPLNEAEAAISVGEADCAFGVYGVPASWAKQMVDDGMTLSWVYDKDLNDMEFPKGSSLYNALRIRAGSYPSKFDTYKIPAVLFRSAVAKVDAQIDKLILRIAPSIGKRYNTVLE